jgi:hypothetical protein
MRTALTRIVRRLQGQPRPQPQPILAAAPAQTIPTWTAPRTGGVHWQ